jgi:uncharacterized protein YkwD
MNLLKNLFQHCPSGYSECIWTISTGSTQDAKRIVDDWFNSPPHRAILTGKSITRAGGVIMSNKSRAVSAIRVT